MSMCMYEYLEFSCVNPLCYIVMEKVKELNERGDMGMQKIVTDIFIYVNIYSYTYICIKSYNICIYYNILQQIYLHMKKSVLKLFRS